MKMIFYNLFCTMFMIIFFFPMYGSSQTIDLTGIERCPYVCKFGSENPGFLLEIAEIGFKRAGYKINFKILPWSRAVIYTKAGIVNGLIGVSKRNAPELIYPDVEQAYTKIFFFVRQNNEWRYNGLLSLRKIKLGVIQNYSYGEMNSYIRKYNNTDYVQAVSGEGALKINIRKINYNRINAILEDYIIMEYTLKKMGKTVKLIKAGQLFGDKLYIGISPSHPEAKKLAASISQTMKDLRRSGKLSMILSKYELKDWIFIK